MLQERLTRGPPGTYGRILPGACLRGTQLQLRLHLPGNRLLLFNKLGRNPFKSRRPEIFLQNQRAAQGTFTFVWCAARERHGRGESHEPHLPRQQQGRRGVKPPCRRNPRLCHGHLSPAPLRDPAGGSVFL